MAGRNAVRAGGCPHVLLLSLPPLSVGGLEIHSFSTDYGIGPLLANYLAHGRLSWLCVSVYVTCWVCLMHIQITTEFIGYVAKDPVHERGKFLQVLCNV